MKKSVIGIDEPGAGPFPQVIPEEFRAAATLRIVTQEDPVEYQPDDPFLLAVVPRRELVQVPGIGQAPTLIGTLVQALLD